MLTVGTNPLPVWVALHHLKDNLPAPIHVRLVHTKETKPERDRLLKCSRDVSAIDTVETVSGNPTTVRNDITQNLIHNLPDNITCIHVHYTGGTKVMCVETVAAAENIKVSLPTRNMDIETSYLDPRADAGATLIDRNGNILVSDTRKGVEPRLQRIAELNGFELGPFPYEYWDEVGNNQTRNCPAPNTLNREQVAKGRAAFNSGRLTSALFEYGAYAAFQDTLADISRQCSDRSNYGLFHKVYVRRANVSDASVKPFELDVVAVLGYQIVVVSCTLASKHALVKQKGMEAILRMRQLGGIEARAIVLCGASQEAQQLIQAELKEETGHSSLSLEIWGKDTWYHLQQTFHQYVRTAFGWT